MAQTDSTRELKVTKRHNAEAKHTPGPWDYVPSNEHHGPYVTTEYGSTVCDCYCMSNPSGLSVRNGGNSKPIHHMYEMAEANARLIAAAPEMLSELKRDLQFAREMKMLMEVLKGRGWVQYELAAQRIEALETIIAKAEGR